MTDTETSPIRRERWIYRDESTGHGFISEERDFSAAGLEEIHMIEMIGGDIGPMTRAQARKWIGEMMSEITMFSGAGAEITQKEVFKKLGIE
jgi:hypothetical protein